MLFSRFLVQKNKKTDSFKIPLFKRNCVPHPELALSTTWIQLGVIIFFLIMFGLFSGLLTQLNILVSSSFYPDIEMKRIHYLHAKLLKKRAKLQEETGKNMFARTVSHEICGEKEIFLLCGSQIQEILKHFLTSIMC